VNSAAAHRRVGLSAARASGIAQWSFGLRGMARAASSRNGALMTPKILSRRFRPHRDERLRRKNALIDEAMDRYVEWREECAAVNDAYAYWTNAPMEETDLPFAAYSAALDREQSAATVYGRALERLED
jgi:hypothetical protein